MESRQLTNPTAPPSPFQFGRPQPLFQANVALRDRPKLRQLENFCSSRNFYSLFVKFKPSLSQILLSCDMRNLDYVDSCTLSQVFCRFSTENLDLVWLEQHMMGCMYIVFCLMIFRSLNYLSSLLFGVSLLSVCFCMERGGSM